MYLQPLGKTNFFLLKQQSIIKMMQEKTPNTSKELSNYIFREGIINNIKMGQLLNFITLSTFLVAVMMPIFSE